MNKDRLENPDPSDCTKLILWRADPAGQVAQKQFAPVKNCTMQKPKELIDLLDPSKNKLVIFFL